MATLTRTHGTAAYDERASGCGTLHRLSVRVCLRFSSSLPTTDWHLVSALSEAWTLPVFDPLRQFANDLDGFSLP